ncbi:MAG TPA: diaminopimelate decarboxylase, partial [Vicinamibacterales bacterium]|nr:diaminopimelate decarboxylase [Vicinamibacterales bacterium]
YSAATIAARYRAIDDAFAGYPHSIHYALKANSTLAIARLLRALGGSADANSGGEIDVALRAGFAPEQIVFTGVGKTRAELEHAIALGIKAINVESAGEIERIDAIAAPRGARVDIALRINPDIDARTHSHISTGRRSNKFGIAFDRVKEIARAARIRAGVRIVGLHIHIGSQITDLGPLTAAARALVDLAGELRDAGTSIEHLDLGGGLGVSYDGSAVPSASDYAAALLPVVRESGLAIILEPGRQIMAPAGALLTRIVDVKPQDDGKIFVVMDAGMTEIIRPMLYNAFHRIEPVLATTGEAVAADIVGPLCESSDTL